MITLTGAVSNKKFHKEEICLSGDILFKHVEFNNCELVDKITSVNPDSQYISIIGCDIDTNGNGFDFINMFLRSANFTWGGKTSVELNWSGVQPCKKSDFRKGGRR